MKKKSLLCLFFCLSCLMAFAQFNIEKSEFIFEKAPFASCHASTIAATPDGLLCAWFGGSDEGNPDVGIWLSKQINGLWSQAVEVANGVQNDSLRYPCWNPVLFQYPGAELLLFYKVGPSPREWWGMLKRSYDGGQTWTEAETLASGILGPIKNKPVLLPDTKTLLCPSSSEHDGWRVHFEKTSDKGKTWEKIGPINNGITYAAIQPSILFVSKNKLKILCRSKNGKILEASSADLGKNWTGLKPTSLPNPSSGTDAVSLANGGHLLVYNDRDFESRKTENDREDLSLAFSKNAKKWRKIAQLEFEDKQEFSYPAIIQSADNKIHITYTWKRQKIKHIVLSRR